MKADAVTLGSSQRLFSAMLDNQAADEAFIAILKKNSRIAGHAATAVYRNNTIGTRKRTLQAIYPVVEKILGASCFDMLASDFVNDSPSIDSDLNLYSQGFPNFLHKLSNNEAVFSDLPYLQDLAMLEWLYHKAYYMADDAAITPDQFAGIDSSVKIERSRALFCIRTTFPVYDIWTMHQGSESVSEVTALSDEDQILIFRHNGHPLVQQLDREEWSILQSLEVPEELDAVVQSALLEGVDVEKKLPEMIGRGWLRLRQCV